MDGHWPVTSLEIGLFSGVVDMNDFIYLSAGRFHIWQMLFQSNMVGHG